MDGTKRSPFNISPDIRVICSHGVTYITLTLDENIKNNQNKKVVEHIITVLIITDVSIESSTKMQWNNTHAFPQKNVAK